MADKLPFTSIGDLCDAGWISIQTGPFGSQLHAYDYESEGVPVVPTEAIGRRMLKIDALPRVSPATVERLSRHKLQVGDILFARRGVQATGYSALVEPYHEGWLCGTGAIRLRSHTDQLDTAFLSFLLSDDRSISWFKAHAVGAVMPNLNEEVIKSFPLALPPLPKQRAIARILGSLDDKIELNRRMNATLEETARAIFQSWFVDFDPVHAKAAGRTPVGLNPDIAALFPDGFEVVEGREVPGGWEITSLDKIANYLNGLALQKYPADGDDFLPVIKIAQMRKGNTDGSDRASPSIPSAYVVEDGDVLFSWSGSLEVMIWCGGHGALNQHLFKVTSDRYPKWFYYLWTKHHLPEFQFIAEGKVTTMGHIQRHHLTEAEVVVAPTPVMQAAHEIIGPLMDHFIANSLQSRTLGALRDVLLPKLLSGELRVNEAEKMVEKVV